MKNSKFSIFLILIPIFFILTLIIVDTVFSYVENKRFKDITENIIREVMTDNDISEEDYYEEIKKRYEKKRYDTEVLVVETNSDKVYVENDRLYFGIFSSFTNKKSVESEVKILGIPFKVKKNSVTRIKVTAGFNDEDKIEFEYTK